MTLPVSSGDDTLRVVDDDKLYAPEIKRHSLEKIRLHNRYARIFATAMHTKWPQLAYVGLYAGAGRARLAGTADFVETSALAVLRQPNRFTHYIYVDNDTRCIEALRRRTETLAGNARVTILEADVNESAELVRAALPSFDKGRGLLSFCFVDPFDLELRFETIRKLGRLKMDFLVLLMLGVDGRRNMHRYLKDSTSTRIGDLIDCNNWRNEYKPNDGVIHFVLRKFDEAMQRLGYLPASDQRHSIRVTGMGVLQYILAFYSKHELGRELWKETRESLSQQLGLGL